jgi:hypothetical protein
MQASFSVADDDQAELNSPDGWLCQERELAARVTFVRLRPTGRRIWCAWGGRGGRVGSGGAVAVLALLEGRISSPGCSHTLISAHGVDGRTVEDGTGHTVGDCVDGLAHQLPVPRTHGE